MKVAAVQMVSSTDVSGNIESARRLIAQAAQQGARLVSLPEYFCLMGRHDSDKLAIAEAPGVGPIQQMLSQAAREHRVWLIGGTIPIRCGDARRVLNANGVYAPDGRLVARYDKIHLFRYDNGRERYDEGCTIQAGGAPVTFDTGGDVPATTGEPSRQAVEQAVAQAKPDQALAPVASPSTEPALRVGLSVCYDLRFPELYRSMMEPPCDLLSVPAAFTHTTGLAHWELLLRARAVENQCYVIAAAQGGLHENGRRTFGHSMVVDSWGEVLGVWADGEGLVLADVDPARITSVREQLPALQHRRILNLS